MSKQFQLSVDEFDQSARQRVRKILRKYSSFRSVASDCPRLSGMVLANLSGESSAFEESHEEAEQNEQMREDWVVSVIDFGPVRLSLWT